MPSPTVKRVKLSPATITPRQFLRLQDKLIRELTPAWRDEMIAAYARLVEPPPIAEQPRKLLKDVRLIESRPPVRLQQVLEVAATLAQPGESLPLRRIAKALGLPISTVRSCTRRMREDESWPYADAVRQWRKKPCPASSR